MALKLDYTKKDYTSLLEHVKDAVRKEFPQWNDFLDSDIGFAIIKTAVAVADVNHFYLDRQAAEAYLDTAHERANVISQAKSLGYTPRSISPARVIGQFRIAEPYNESIIIPRYTSLTIEGKPYITEEEGTLLAGSTTVEIQCVQGSYYRTTSRTTGEAFFKITLPLNVAEVSVQVEDELWVETPSFILRPTNPNAYRLYEDRTNKVVMFGSLMYTTPPAQSNVIVDGIQTSGAEGNTRYANSPITITSPLYNSLNQNISNLFSASAIGSATGGSDVESIDSIKVVAPGVYSAQNRSVTANDYKYLALTVPGVAEASAWGGELINRYGEAYVCIIAENASTGMESLIELVKAKIEPLRVLSILPKVISAEEVFVDLAFNGSVKRQYMEYGLQSAITTRIQSYFNELKIGDMLQFSDLMAHMQSVEQIDYYMMSHQVWLRGIINAGKLTVSHIKNADYSSVEVWSSDRSARIWQTGDSGQLSVQGQNMVIFGLSDAPDGPCWVSHKTLDVNVLLQPYHKLRVGQVSVTLNKSQA